MTDWEKINEIVVDALELDTGEREDFVEKSCGDSAELKNEVKSLLAGEPQAADFFDSPAVFQYAEFFAEDGKKDGLAKQKIGVYTIERELGYGGMGAVYLASRTDGKFEQRVALKMLKREMNTADLRRRFQTEREILASLEHPNIARLLNAGTTEDKIPYIAMEYVEGLPIDDYCNKNGLDLDERLNLFRKVCAAVDFAHRNLIVHRDLKPSNIFVTKDGTPKLLDFGISKILSEDLSLINKATVTKLGVMTPGYASPEQLQSKSVTTATDVYSLGIILYEMLSGHRPFEDKENDLKAIYNAVIENEPPMPSAWNADLSKGNFGAWKTDSESKTERLPDKITNKSKHRTNPKSTNHNLKLNSDLDNIILKALKKEPERRYSSAENFAADIERHQKGIPVTARPDTFSYRAGKFVKRNSLAVGAAVLILLTLVGGIVATLWQARQAQAEAAKAQKINEYLQNVLNFSNPHWLSSNPKRNREAKISDALEEALKTIDTDLADAPEVQAEILLTIAQTYIGQGRYEEAIKLLTESIEKFDRIYGEENTKSMQATVMLADSQNLIAKYDVAEKNYNKAINYFQPRVSESKTNVKFLAIALTDLGNIFLVTRDIEKANELNLKSLELARKLEGKDRFMIPIVMQNIGTGKFNLGDYESALKYYTEALEEIRLMGNENSQEAGNLYMSVGVSYARLSELKKAEDHLLKANEILKNTTDKDNYFTLNARHFLAELYYLQEKYDKSEEQTRKNLEAAQKVFPNGHFIVANSQILLGNNLTKKGKLKDAENLYRQALKYNSKTYQAPNPYISSSKFSLGKNLAAQKRFDEAKELFKSALDDYIKINDPKAKEVRAEFEKLSKQ